MLFRRDLAIARSYRAAFILEFFYALFGAAASFYFLSKFIRQPSVQRSLPQGQPSFFICAGRNCVS